MNDATVLISYIALLASAGAVLKIRSGRTLVANILNKLPKPAPDYGKVKEVVLSPTSVPELYERSERFFDFGKEQIRSNAPSIFKHYWWQILVRDRDNLSLKVVLSYAEDINAERPVLVDVDVCYQEFDLMMTLNFHNCRRPVALKRPSGVKNGQPPGIAQSQIDIDWCVENKYNNLSRKAKTAVAFTVSHLEEIMYGSYRPIESSPNLMAHLDKARRREPPQEWLFTNVPHHMTQSLTAWPTPQEFNEAIQNPATAFCDNDLRGCQPEVNSLGLPKAATGAFASVYKLSSGARNWAVKCFLRDVQDQSERYANISDFVRGHPLPCTVDFAFDAQGILVKGMRHPVLKMSWVEGALLQSYIDVNASDVSAMQWLAEQFLSLIKSLEAAAVAHGDLQHGNILITDKGLLLVDYDGMYVPSLKGKLSNELGHRNYQHSRRNETHFGPYIDRFSAWLIYLSLKFIALDPQLYLGDDTAGDECILFRQSDFAEPGTSAIFNRLIEHSNSEIKAACAFLLGLLKQDPSEIPPLRRESH